MSIISPTIKRLPSSPTSLETTQTKDEKSFKMNMEELEIFFNKTLSNSQISINENVLENEIEPTESNMMTAIALALTRTLKVNDQLRADLDYLQTSFSNFKSESQKLETHRLNSHVNFQASITGLINEKFEETSRIVDKTLDDNAEMRDDLDSVKTEIAEGKVSNEELENKILIIEKELADLQQYIRRPTIEISGVSERIQQCDLENFVINKILRPIGVEVSCEDIEACHRLIKRNPHKPAHVVVRFVNRKNANDARHNRFLLRNFNHLRGIWIFDNLCPQYRHIFEQLSKLKEKGIVKHVWSYNGKVSYKKSHNRWARGTRINHKNDLHPLQAEADFADFIKDQCNQSIFPRTGVEQTNVEASTAESSQSTSVEPRLEDLMTMNAQSDERPGSNESTSGTPIADLPTDSTESIVPVEEISSSDQSILPVSQTSRNTSVEPSIEPMAESSSFAAAPDQSTLTCLSSTPDLNELIVLPSALADVSASLNQSSSVKEPSPVNQTVAPAVNQTVAPAVNESTPHLYIDRSVPPVDQTNVEASTAESTNYHEGASQSSSAEPRLEDLMSLNDQSDEHHRLNESTSGTPVADLPNTSVEPLTESMAESSSFAAASDESTTCLSSTPELNELIVLPSALADASASLNQSSRVEDQSVVPAVKESMPHIDSNVAPAPEILVTSVTDPSIESATTVNVISTVEQLINPAEESTVDLINKTIDAICLSTNTNTVVTPSSDPFIESDSELLSTSVQNSCMVSSSIVDPLEETGDYPTEAEIEHLKSTFASFCYEYSK